MKKTDLDPFDHALLVEVQKNNLTPVRLLAERVALSESAVFRRLRRLRKEGIIAADISVISPSALGKSQTVVTLVELERESNVALDQFSKKMRSHDEVKRCWYVAGETDFVLVLQVSDMAQYDSFCSTAFLDDPNVKTFTTLVVMRNVIAQPPLM
jgi:Lrp/AsnC family transcriptional regulator, leucine-responsive regulatory protein